MVLVVTFLLTMLIPLQYAVVVGVGVSVVLYVVRESNQVTIRRRVRDGEGHVVEVDPPGELPGERSGRAAAVREPLLRGGARLRGRPAGRGRGLSAGPVVILRLRGRTDLGTTFMDVLHRYAVSLRDAGSKLVIVSANERILEQLEVTGTVDVIGPANVYMGDERVGATLERAYEDALAWVAERSDG